MYLKAEKKLPFKVKSTNFDFVINSFVGKQQIVPIVEQPRPQIVQEFKKIGGKGQARKMKRRMSSECYSES